MMQLIYVADPMCSWCYGFSREISQLINQQGGVQLQLVLGGLRPFTTQIMDEERKAVLKQHWEEVEKVSGLPFSSSTMSQKSFVYDTEPACRAVVTVRETIPEISLSYMHAIQKSFYAEGLDITQKNVLSDIAVKVGLDRKTFETTFELAETKEATNEDFEMTKRWNITGFPTLLLKKGNKLEVLTIGYTKFENLLSQIKEANSPYQNT